MQTWHIFATVVAVLAIIIGNIAFIRHSAKMEFKAPTTKKIKSPD